jgi:hypothetical protein
METDAIIVSDTKVRDISELDRNPRLQMGMVVARRIKAAVRATLLVVVLERLARLESGAVNNIIPWLKAGWLSAIPR